MGSGAKIGLVYSQLNPVEGPHPKFWTKIINIIGFYFYQRHTMKTEN